MKPANPWQKVFEAREAEQKAAAAVQSEAVKALQRFPVRSLTWFHAAEKAHAAAVKASQLALQEAFSVTVFPNPFAAEEAK